MEGRDISIYLDKIIVRGGFFTMYFVSIPIGASRDLPRFGNWAESTVFTGLIQDLDNPSKRPLIARSKDTVYENGYSAAIWVFDNHNISHFSFAQTATYGSETYPSRILEEVVMGEPDN